MQAAANFNKPLELQVTVPLTLNGFQFMGTSKFDHDWFYQGSKVYRDPNNFTRGCSNCARRGIVVGSIQLNPATNQIANIALNHFSYREETEADIEDTRGYIGSVFSSFPKSHTYLFIIGDDQVTPHGNLLSDIRAAIEKHFGNTDCIRQQKLDVLKDNSYNTLEAGILPDGTMHYRVY